MLPLILLPPKPTLRTSLANHLAVSALALFTLGCNAPRDSLPLIESSGTTATAANEAGSDPASTESSAPSVDVALIDYDGLQESIASFAGKVVVVDIWSTACPPCMKEFPHLVELSQKYPDKLACISLNVDFMGLPRETPESHLAKVKEFLVKQEASTVTNYVASEPDSDILQKYDVASMPAIIVIDVDGEKAATITDSNAGEDGLSYAGDVVPQVEALLATTDNS